jgi:hypothetical protein
VSSTNHEAPGCVVFAGDDTSITVCHSKRDHFQNCITDACTKLNKWFTANELTPNFDKTNFIKFATNNETWVNLNIGYGNETKKLL